MWGELINGKQERTFRHEIRKLADKPVNLRLSRWIAAGAKYQTLGIDFVLKKHRCGICFPDAYVGLFCNQGNTKTHITNLGMADRVSEIERENQVFPFGGTLTLEFTEKFIYNN